MRTERLTCWKGWMAAVGCLALLIPSILAAGVSPIMVQEIVPPGESIDVTKTVVLPDIPPKLDICLIVDLSGSYGDDLPNIKSLAPGLWDDVKAEVDDLRFGLASFVDYPFIPWGDSGSGDYAYSRDQDLTPTKATWLAAVNAMSTRYGYDEPESQYEAFYQVATGLGRDVPPLGGEPGLGDIAPGQQCSFRADATKIAILTTDASFHNAGDGGSFPYPGPSAAATEAALIAAGIKVIGLKAPGAGGELDALAAATGGSVQNTTSSSSDIAEAILAALEDLTFTVAGVPELCDPLLITFDPEGYTDVPGGETVEFVETIAVPADVDPDDLDENGAVHCTVDFLADDAVIGTQELWITVVRSVDIDIKPGSFPNSINCEQDEGVIPVAILGSDDFDVMMVDFETLAFGPTGGWPTHQKGHYSDVNDDGFVDMVTHHRRGATGILCNDVEACLTGLTFDGIPIEGCDSVRTVPPHADGS